MTARKKEISGERKSSRKTLKAANKQFYAKVLDEAEKIDFEAAAGTEGLDDEITLLRVKIKNILEKEPENLALLMAATNMLAKLVKIRYNMTKAEKKGLGEAIRNVVKDVALPLLTGPAAAALINRRNQ